MRLSAPFGECDLFLALGKTRAVGLAALVKAMGACDAGDIMK